MKKILILLLFFGLAMNAQTQHSISAGFDPAVSIYGGHLKVKGFNYMFRYYYNTLYEEQQDVWSNDEVGLFYERFEKLNYGSAGIFFNKVYYPRIKNTELALGIEGSVIHRDIWEFRDEGKVHHYFWSYGINLEPRFNLGDSFRIGLLMNYKRRTDIEKFVYSNYVLITFKF